jgi:hypothetical protein
LVLVSAAIEDVRGGHHVALLLEVRSRYAVP